MTTEQTKRLADIRARCLEWSVITDTRTWESRFFLELLDQKNREIDALRRQARMK